MYIVIPKNMKKSLHFSDIIFKLVYENYQTKWQN